MKPRCNPFLGAAVCAAFSLVFAAIPAHSGTVTWSGASGADWDTGTNWSGSAKPLIADTALFNLTGITSVTNATADQAVTSITFDTDIASTGAFTLGTTGGNKFTLQDTGTIQVLSTLTGTGKTITVNAPIVLAGTSYNFVNDSASVTNTLKFGGTIKSTSGTTILTLGGANTGSNTISGIISNGASGTMGVTKTGNGKWILTGVNTYTGTTTISAGTLQIGNGSGGTGSLSSSSSVVNNASLVYDITGSTANNVLPWMAIYSTTGSGNLTVNGGASGSLLVGGNVTQGGSMSFTTQSGATWDGLRIENATRTFTASSISITGLVGSKNGGDSTLKLDTSAANGPITLDLQTGATGRQYGVALNADAGTGTLTMAGTKAATSWGVNTTLRGALNISSSFTVGALSLTATAASSVAGNLTLAAATNTFTSDPGVTLAVSGNLLTSAANPAITKNGAGTLTLSGTNTYTGATTINGGELLVPSTGSIGNNSATTVNNTGTLVIVAATGGRTLANNLTLNGGTVRGGVQDNVGTGGTVVVGAGTVTHVFTSSGTLTLQAPVTANELLVGGGGGSKSFSGWYSSGGGGGKVANLTSQSLSAGATTVTVGTGGAVGADGGATSIGANTAAGGLFATVAGKGGTSGSGNAGGAGVGVANGGGGGDSAVGGVGTNPTVGGAGGAGSANTAIVGLKGYGQLSGGSYYFGGGGGGGAQTNNALGGLGGGGQANVAGAANTGGGAGANAAGGSGIAVVQYAYNPYAVGGNLTLSGSIDVQSASTLDTYISGALMDITGVMQTTTGTGGITIASSSTAGGVVRYSNAMTYLGNTTINSGATLRMNATNAMPYGVGKGNLVVNGNGVLDLNGQTTTTVNALSLSGTGISSGGALVNNNGATTATITATNGIALGANTSIGGSANISTSSVISGSNFGVTKIGNGTLTLSGANTYTGATTVSAGKLAVNGSTSASSAVGVSSGGTLSGSGTVGGNTTIASGGMLAPGNSPGVLTVAGTTTISSGSIFEWEIDTAQSNPETNRGVAYDGLNTTSLSGSGAIFKIMLTGTQDFTDGLWNQTRTWTDIFKSANGSTNLADWAAVFSGGFQYAYNGKTVAPTSSGSFALAGNTLTWSAVPEPSNLLVGLLIGAGLLRRRRNA